LELTESFNVGFLGLKWEFGSFSCIHAILHVKAKETKKCHHRQLMSTDAVEFGQLRRMRTLLCYGLSADSRAPAVGADWAVT
jgi:hypothetical protein